MSDFVLAQRWSSARSQPHIQISSGTRIPELDGARGIAVLAVVIAHYFGEVEHGLIFFTFGWMGVNLFFVLSGFLIGSIILERKDSPNFLSVFYIRRALRILPVYFVTLAATLGFIWLYGPAPWIDTPLPAVSYFTFTQNILMAWRDEVGELWLLPTWTLAVEEQFYLVFPLLILLIPARLRLPTIIGGIALCVLARVLFSLAGAGMPSRFLLFTSGHILLVGALAAYIQQNIKVPDIMLRTIPPVSIAALCITTLSFRISLHHVFLAFVAPMFASYILLATQGWPVLRFLRSRTLGAFGKVSYCLYLIHQPINGVLHGLFLGSRPDIATSPQILVTCTAVMGSIFIAGVSWFVLEQPLLRLGRRVSWDD